MQMFRALLGTTIALTLCAPVAWAQQGHVVSKAALDQAVQQRVIQEQSDRAALRDFLQQPAVKEAAAKAGLQLDKAEAAVSTLQGQDLAQAAAQARTVNTARRRRQHDRHLDHDDHHRAPDRHPHSRAQVTRRAPLTRRLTSAAAAFVVAAALSSPAVAQPGRQAPVAPPTSG